MLKLYKNFDENLARENMMGPNVIRLAEELAQHMDLKPGMRVLDLGCGKGLSSLFLAKEFGVTVYAADLWISPGENFKRIVKTGLEDKVIPIHCNAHELPFAEEYFDGIVSFDSYHYFGTDERYLRDDLIKYLKVGGQIGMASPGLTHELSTKELDGLKEYYVCGKFLTFHSASWWKNLWERSLVVDVTEAFDLQSHHEAWQDWLHCGNPIGEADKPFYAHVKQLATIGITARRNNNDYHSL